MGRHPRRAPPDLTGRCRRPRKSRARMVGLLMRTLSDPGQSHVEAELHDVAVGHYVVLALHADAAGLLGLLHRAGGEEVVVRDDLGLDEAALEVGVDDAGGL